MKLMRSIALIFILTQSLSAFAAKDFQAALQTIYNSHDRELTEILVTSRTVGTLYRRLRPLMTIDAADFLKAKFKGLENRPLRILNKGGNRFVLESRGQFITFSLGDRTPDRQSFLTVNRHELIFEPGQSPEEKWQLILQALPRTHAGAEWSPFPQAHAQNNFEIWAANLAGGPIYGAHEARASQTVCDEYHLTINFCRSQLWTKADVISAATFDQSWLTRVSRFVRRCTGEFKQLKPCLQAEAVRLKMSDFPSHLHGYFNKPTVSSDTPAAVK